MDSRTDRYLNSSNDNNGQLSRSSRNSKLYKQVYGSYRGLDNLPMEDNTDEIDMDRLKEILSNNRTRERNVNNRDNLDVIEPRKRNIDDKKIYDINKLLEKAKYENNKIKEPRNNIVNKSKSILSTLEDSDLSITDIKNAYNNYDSSNSDKVVQEHNNEPDNLTMTREMKYHTRNISMDPMINQVLPEDSDTDLSLDLLSDLKPTENTIITKPINKENSGNKKEDKFFPTGDTSDIDIIKKESLDKAREPEVDDDFFTSSYHFSKKDFADDDFYDEKSHNVLKIILLIIAIIVFAGVIFYFVLNYGISS